MRLLTAKWFLGTRENPEHGTNECLDFVKFYNIKQEDIQQIVHDHFAVILYYWKEF